MPAPPEHDPDPRASPPGGMTRYERRFDAHPSRLREIRRFVRRRAAGAGVSALDSDELVAAVSEAAANAIQHSGAQRIRVIWAERSDRVEVAVVDDGVFRPLLREASTDPLSATDGRGLWIMSALVDRMRIEPGTRGSPGTVVELVKLRR
jgi:anti-sigma regulatory factor (Ser/Thr protein kinase)